MAELAFFVEAFLISFVLTGFILRFSLKRNLLDIPNDRSSHSVPKPRLGGFAMTAAFYATFATMFLFHVKPLPSASLAGILIGGAVIAGVGLLDDLLRIDARVKLLAQFGAAAVPVSTGVILTSVKIPLIGSLALGPLAVPFTLLWIMALINFYNFVDGIDGLAAGLGMIASAFLFLIFGMTGANDMQALYAVIAGASFGFLRYNFPPARIFMGDMGSTFIGYMFAVLAIIGERRGVPAFMTILLLAGVIGDTALTLVKRALKKERLFLPHRTHYYQRLTSLGLSHKQVTLLEYLVAILLGVSALLAFHREWTFVTFLSVVWIGFFIWALAKIRSMERGERLLWEGRTLGIAVGDLVFIALSYMLSYYLRLNFRFPHAETSSMLISLPIVLVIRTAVFFYYGLYRGVWRYTTVDDVVRIAKAVSIGSAIMVVSFTLLFRFEAFPRSVFIIDWFILIVFMAGSRIATRWFHELPSREEISGRRVVIAGTGPVAELVLGRVKKTGGLHPIGYLDDRTEMTGRTVHGLKVLGPLSDIEDVVRRHRVEEVIALRSFADRVPRESRERLERSGVLLRVVSDPSEIAVREARDAEAPYADGRVLVIGNGSLVEAAEGVFTQSRELILASNDGRVLEGTACLGGAGTAKRACYLGIVGDRAALRGVIERHRPEVVFADFLLRNAGLSNTLDAFVRTVIVPLEALASEVARVPGMRLAVVSRKAAAGSGELEEAARALECILRDIFRGEPSRLALLRLDSIPSVVGWSGIIAGLAASGGGISMPPAGRRESAGAIERAAEVCPSSGIGGLFTKLTGCLADGDAAGMRKALREIASPVEEHVS